MEPLRENRGAAGAIQYQGQPGGVRKKSQGAAPKGGRGGAWRGAGLKRAKRETGEPMYASASKWELVWITESERGPVPAEGRQTKRRADGCYGEL